MRNWLGSMALRGVGMRSDRRFLRPVRALGGARFFHVNCPPDGSDCWNCKQPVCRRGLMAVDFFCPSCEVIQKPVKDVTYFDIFSLPADFKINAKQLERSYWDLQKRLHPDGYGQKSTVEQDYSAQQSSVVNEAYNTLKDPLRRSVYMLELLNVDALSETGRTETDPAVLMRAMEDREMLEESIGDREALSELKREAKSRIATMEAELGERFDEGDVGGATKIAVNLRYSVKLLEEVESELVKCVDNFN
mmetsp:Transcript_42565/g.68541  ORF Transcript_42565/g.68541 Transcript_42565/m.68541 type:complete len:249 (+) Transcript_42565:67-813(+)